MRTALALFIALILSSNAAAFQPRAGVWWNAKEPGSGYTIEIQNGTLILGAYTYKPGGDSEWYLAQGPLTNGGTMFSATLDYYRNGQCISCAYVGAISPGNDGVISISFTSEISANVKLPGGRTTTITPYDFGFGEPPTGLLGEWIFVYDIGSTTYAERFNFSTWISGTSTGNGLALDDVRNATCELQTSGSMTGTVFCADFSSNFDTQNMYEFTYGLDETYNGYWISPWTYNEYSMKGFRIRGSNGVAKSAVIGAAMDDDPMVSTSKAAQERAVAMSAPDATIRAAFAEIADRLRAALR